MNRKYSRFVLLVVGLFVLMAVSGCGAKQIQTGAEDQGRTVELAAGETLLVTLESNPTTGYSWQVSEVDEAVLKRKGEPEYKQRAGSEGLVGAGGAETFRFEAAGAGRTTLTLVYARPWEQDVPPVETYSIVVVVK